MSSHAMALTLAHVRSDFLKQHQAPGKLVDWNCDLAQWGKDEAGNKTFTMDIIGAVVGKGQDQGVLYVTRINVSVDPETGEALYTLNNIEGGEGYDAFDCPLDDLKGYFPTGPLVGGATRNPDFGQGGGGEEGGGDDGGQPVQAGGEHVEPETPGTALSWTPHVTELQKSASELAEALAVVKSWSQKPADENEAAKWAADLKEAGYDAVRAVDNYSFVFSEFVDPVTRAGLTTDIALAKENAIRVADIVTGYGTLLGLQIVKTEAEQESVRQQALRELQTHLAKRIGERFHSQGLAAVLTSDGLHAAEIETRTRITNKLKSRAEEISNHWLRIPFYNIPTARAAALHKVRQLARQRIAELLCSITSKKIVVQFVGEVVYSLLENLIGPLVRDWFRTTGNLDHRVEQSTATLRAQRMRLLGLSRDAMLDEVRAEMLRSEGTYNATRYLLADLARAKSPLEEWYHIEVEDLARAHRFTHKRFFLDSAGELEEMKSAAQLMITLASLLREIVDGIEVPVVVAEGVDQGGYDEKEEGDEEADEDPDKPVIPLITYDKPVFLYHITKWHGPNGPVNKDYWYATAGEPAEDAPNIILVSSANGGVEISEFSSRSGSLSTNHALMKALAAAGARSAYIGATTISANPDP